eukprot:4931038-Ditylum_brightwellii.AAC.1
MVIMKELGKEPMVAEPMEQEPPVEIEVTKGTIHDTAAELVQLKEKVVWLDSRCEKLSARCAGLEPVVLFANFVNLDTALAGHKIATTICEGIFKDKNQDKTLIIPWSGTDPD